MIEAPEVGTAEATAAVEMAEVTGTEAEVTGALTGVTETEGEEAAREVTEVTAATEEIEVNSKLVVGIAEAEMENKRAARMVLVWRENIVYV